MLADALRRIGLMGAVIKSIQQVTVTIDPGSTTGNAPIAAVDLSKTFVVTSKATPSTNHQMQHAVARVFLSSSTNLRAVRGGTTNPLVLTCFVVEFASGARVQSNDVTLASGSAVTNLATVVNPLKSFVVGSESGALALTNIAGYLHRYELGGSGDVVNTYRQDSGLSVTTGTFYVVEFT